MNGASTWGTTDEIEFATRLSKSSKDKFLKYAEGIKTRERWDKLDKNKILTYVATLANALSSIQ